MTRGTETNCRGTETNCRGTETNCRETETNCRGTETNISFSESTVLSASPAGFYSAVKHMLLSLQSHKRWLIARPF